MKIRLLIVLLLSFQASMAWGVACDAIFTNGVQSHNPGGQVQLGYQVEIDGGSDELSTANLNMQSPPGQGTCDGSTCTASGSPAASSTPAFVFGNGSDGAVNVTGGGNNNLGAGDYTSVSVNAFRRLTFNDANSTYLMESLSTGFQSEVRFRAGDYWIDGNMNIGQGTELNRLGGGGAVRIFVNGDVQLNYQVFTNGFAPGELLIYATGNITLGQQTDVSGFFYAGGNMQVDYLAEVNGAVSGGSAQLAQWVEINYDGGALAAPDFAPFCDAEDEDPALLVSHWAMDEFLWDGTPGEVLDSSGNGNNATANSAVTDGATPAIPGDPGTCRYGVFDGVDDYLAAPNVSATLNATASLAFWINTTQTGNNTAWQAPGVTGVEQSGGADDIFWGWLDASGRIGVAVGNDNNTKSNSSINNGSWHHVVLTRDHQAGTYQVFIDGSLDASGGIATGVIGTGYASIGRVENTGATAPVHLEALLDEVHIFDGVLTPAEVSALMMQTRPCLTELCPNPDNDPLGGVLGDYYNSTTFAGGVVGTRVDGPVNFNWGNGAPGVSGVNANQFSVDWNGYIRATETGDYTFQTVSDDGVRLWVDGQLVIQRWNDHAATTDTSGPVSLVAGQVYPIQLQFYENGGQAEIRLRWQTPSGGGYVPIPAGSTPALGQGLYHCSSTAVDHYTISHSGNGVTCEAEPITITARDSGGNAIAPPAGTEVTLGTTPGTGVWVGGNLYTFTGIESQFTVYLQQTTPATLNIDVTDGTATEIASADPDIIFTDTGLRFYGNTALDDLPNQVAGTPDPNPVLRIVQTDSDTGACVGRVQNQTLAVNLAFECLNPTTCVGGQTLSLNGAAVTPNNNGAAINYTPVNLDFDNAGFAGIPLMYTDVGEVQLHGQINLPAEGNNPAVSIAGSSDPFVVKPHTLEVSVVEDSDGELNQGTEGSGDGFVTAGEAFVVRVEAQNSLGNVTPNYGNETTSQVPRLEFGSLVYPAGGNPGTLEVGSFSAQGNGVAENGSVAWSEVGSITLTPRLTGDDYLNAGDLVTITPSGTIGRFYPHQYVMDSSTTTDACVNFTYMEEDAISVGYTLQAHNVGGGTVLNYDNADTYGENYTGTATVNYVAENDDDGIDLDRETIATGQWTAGQLIVNDTAALFARDTAPEAPLADLQLGLVLTDTLDSRPLIDLDMNPTTTGDCTVPDNCTAKALGNPLELRYGRLNLASANGPVEIDLPVYFAAEYFDGTRWQTNSLDSCTTIARDTVFYPAGPLSNEANRTVTLPGGTTTGQYSGSSHPDDISFISGQAGHLFTAPGVSGSFQVRIDLTDKHWLHFDWTDIADKYEDFKPYPEDVPDGFLWGEYRFDSYYGHDRIIYWREVF